MPVKKMASKEAPKKKEAAKPVKKAKPKKAPAKKAEAKKPVKKEEPRKVAYHVSKRASDGLWIVHLENSDKVIKTFKTKPEAVEYVDHLSESTGRAGHVHASKGASKGKIQKR